jgi:hypothetical protein
MREQGIAANATRRFLRGQNKRKNTDKMQRALRRGRSRVMFERVKSVVVDLYDGKDMRDPARQKLIQTRKALVGQWMTTADVLDKQSESTLAREVRTFAKRLPQVITDRERLAVDYIRHKQGQAKMSSHQDIKVKDTEPELTR